MKDIKLLFPVNKPQEISISEKINAKGVYVYYDVFLKNGLDYLEDFIKKARKYNIELYINFKNTVSESEISKVNDLFKQIQQSKIDGILINSYSLLEYIKPKKLPFKVIIDSGLDIHNLSGVEFVSLFQNIDAINITQEIYIKNIDKIKKYTKASLCIDSNNLPWIADDIKKSKAIDTVIIKGEFDNKEELLEGVSLIEKIIKSPKIYKNQNLPFKKLHNYTYETNHFTGEFLSTKGNDIKFRDGIEKFDWKYKKTRLKKDFDYSSIDIPKITLRLRSLGHLKSLEGFINKYGFNPVYAIEFGEILSTRDLAKSSFNEIIDYVKQFCAKHNIKLKLGTPRLLIERDFDRVYEYVKLLFDENPPDSMVINNIGFWWTAINDPDYEKVPIDLGQGLNLLSSGSALCLANQHEVESVDLSSIIDIRNTKACIEKIKGTIPNIKLTVGGSVRIPCSGLCPLNNDSAILSRLSCSAPCHGDFYSVVDEHRNKIYPFAVDGFCRMHMFRNKILDVFKYTDYLKQIGINEFVLDFSCVDGSALAVVLSRFLNSLIDKNYKPDENYLTKLYYLNLYADKATTKSK